jgi:hypothetical protein
VQIAHVGGLTVRNDGARAWMNPQGPCPRRSSSIA